MTDLLLVWRGKNPVHLVFNLSDTGYMGYFLFPARLVFLYPPTACLRA